MVQTAMGNINVISVERDSGWYLLLLHQITKAVFMKTVEILKCFQLKKNVSIWFLYHNHFAKSLAKKVLLYREGIISLRAWRRNSSYIGRKSFR